MLFPAPLLPMIPRFSPANPNICILQRLERFALAVTMINLANFEMRVRQAARPCPSPLQVAAKRAGADMPNWYLKKRFSTEMTMDIKDD